VKVERVDFVDVPTRDVERAITFYRDVIGLPQNPREPTEFEAGNVTLALWEPEKQGVEFPQSTASRCASPTSRLRARSWRDAASSSSVSATRGSATWPSSPTPTATR
jgi:catechol 2,3-dioxygenase-like lactoylglutathione lyase family enzyme